MRSKVKITLTRLKSEDRFACLVEASFSFSRPLWIGSNGFYSFSHYTAKLIILIYGQHRRECDVFTGLGKNGPGKNGPGKNSPEKTVRGIIGLVVESVKTVCSFR